MRRNRLTRGAGLAAWAVLCGLAAADLPPGDPAPLPRAHAHNDYLHNRPLFDALDHGFASVEADIHLVGGKLLVAHDPIAVRAGSTLEKLYLDPLRKRVQQRGGWVYSPGLSFTLLIDVKTEAVATYAVLQDLLARYSDMLTVVRDGVRREGAVTVIISGNRDVATISAAPVRFAGIDGRFGDLKSATPAHLYPLISDNWQKYFQWRGTGPMPEAERQRLVDAVTEAHDRGRRIRLWATPENPAVWRELYLTGVDLINTDDLAGLEAFLKPPPQRNPR